MILEDWYQDVSVHGSSHCSYHRIIKWESYLELANIVGVNLMCEVQDNMTLDIDTQVLIDNKSIDN